MLQDFDIFNPQKYYFHVSIYCAIWSLMCFGMVQKTGKYGSVARGDRLEADAVLEALEANAAQGQL